MTPFLQFRLWLQRGPSSERVAAGLASVLLLALLVWAAVPLNGEGPSADVTLGAGAPTDGQVASDQAVPGGAPGEGPIEGAGELGEPGSASPTVTSGPGGSGAAGPTEGTAGAEAGGDRCAGLKASDQGVSPTEVFVAVSVIELGGEIANSAVGFRSDLDDVVQAATAGVNADGGVACRKLRIKVYKVNPLDQNDTRAKCLQMVDDKPFAVIDWAGFLDPASRACFGAAKLPYQSLAPVNQEEVDRAFPYMYSQAPTTDRDMRNWVFEAHARRSFDPKNGFRKLGLLLDACNSKANSALLENLAKVGVPREQTSSFTTSECGGLASTSEISQAFVQHRNAGVSHVYFGVNGADAQNYVRQADSVAWKPFYMVSDSAGATLPEGGRSNWPAGFDGAIAITSLRTGELNSGIQHPLVQPCFEWMKKANIQPPAGEEFGLLATCDMFRLFVAAANAAGPQLVRSTLLDGLAKVGRFEGAQHMGAVFDRPGKVTGGDFIRAIQWHLDCTCWKVLDRDLKPGH